MCMARAGAAQELYRSSGLKPLEADGNQVIPQPYLALMNANVLDVRTGNILSNTTVVLRDGVILSVGDGGAPSGAQAVDMKGLYIVPGFMDGHVHYGNTDGARRAVAAGVTTTRNASTSGYSDIAIRELVKEGYLVGPDMLAASVYVKPELGDNVLADPRLYKYYGRLVRGEENIRELVQINADRGVDWIKTRSSGMSSGMGGPDPQEQVYNETELGWVVDEAAKFGIPVECHCHGEATIISAVLAGCRTIEHGSYMSEEALALMKEHGTVWSPTYNSVIGFQYPHDDYNTNLARLRAPYILDNLGRMLRKGHEMGVVIITATDTSYRPQSVTRLSGEINNFIEFGMSPLEAIQAATIVSAEVYGIAEKTGAIEAGLGGGPPRLRTQPAGRPDGDA